MGTRIGGWCGSTIRDVTGGTQGLAEPLRPLSVRPAAQITMIGLTNHCSRGHGGLRMRRTPSDPNVTRRRQARYLAPSQRAVPLQSVRQQTNSLLRPCRTETKRCAASR